MGKINYKICNEKGEGVLSTTQIGEILGFTVSVSYLSKLGYEPSVKTLNGYYWEKTKLKDICISISQSVLEVGKNADM